MADAWVAEGSLTRPDADRIYKAAQRAAFGAPEAEIDDLQKVADAALAAGRITAETSDMLGARLKSASKALAQKTAAKAVHYLEQYIDGATRSVTDQTLQSLLVSGGQALVVRLTA